MIREDYKLPTMNSNFWMKEHWSTNHTYCEKGVGNQIFIPAKSALSVKQKMSILSNGVVSRFSNVNAENLGEEDAVEVIEHLTTQLKTLGYDQKQAREIIISGMKSWRRKRQRRSAKGFEFYKRPASTLKSQIRKRLLESVNWLKKR